MLNHRPVWCFLTVSPIFSGRLAGLVACWFELGRVPVPMLFKSALKAVHGRCINNVIWKFVRCTDRARLLKVFARTLSLNLLLCSLKEWPLVAVYSAFVNIYIYVI